MVGEFTDGKEEEQLGNKNGVGFKSEEVSGVGSIEGWVNGLLEAPSREISLGRTDGEQDRGMQLLPGLVGKDDP